jgi:16S rRNA (cytosine1402-N4)-methyltransferase
MRMDCAGPSAADLVNTAEEATLADILYYFGEERASRRIARAIVVDRAKAPFTSTAALAAMIARVAPAKPGEMHAATRTFQALRIAINDELGELVQALGAAEAILKPGGRLAVVTFHSLEDRIVKHFFSARSGRGQAPSRRLPGEPDSPPPTFVLPGKQPVLPSLAEVAANPRARSAKLRHGVRTSAKARTLEDNLLALARLPQRKVAQRKPAQRKLEGR